MSLLSNLLSRKDIWRRIAIERLTEPFHLNAIAAGVAVVGGTRMKIQFDLLVRQQHAYGLLEAADLATARNLERVTVVELGVGNGTGLLNICSLSERISELTGVQFEIVGFDTAVGLPPPQDYRDHPELYKEGWFPMTDRDALVGSLPANARIIFGDLKDTIAAFVRSMRPEAPLGFATLDVDFYSSSKHALQLFTGSADCYFPYVPIYVDDIALPTNTRFAGEQLAIAEFNRDNELRKIDLHANLVHSRVFKHAEWLMHMYKLHVFDHSERSNLSKPETIEAVHNPYLTSVPG